MYPSKIRLSYSSLLVLLECERKFQLIKLLQGAPEKEHSPIFSFGHSWGEGIVEYLESGNMDAAIYAAWRAYYPPLEDSQRIEELAFHGLRFARPKLDAIRQKWEIATFDGKPAKELGFHLDINERFYFEAFIDAVLRHKEDNFYAVLENKHTMQWRDDITPMYRNSGQALCYSIVLDKIAEQPLGQYQLHYLVGQFKSNEPHRPIIHFFPWRKTLLDRLNWFISLGMDIQRLTAMIDMNLFPMRGHSCMNYNRTCPFFGTCQLRGTDSPLTDADQAARDAISQEYKHPIQFRFTLDEIIADHLARAREEIKQ